MKKIVWLLAMFFAFTSMAFAAINLNTATHAELDTVKGIGPAKAQAIIDYRNANGPFKSVDDLKNVKGFGDKTVNKMRSELSVSGASTPKAEEKPAKKEDKKSAHKEDTPATATKVEHQAEHKAEHKDSAKAEVKAPAKEEKKLSKEEKKAAKKAEMDAKKAAKQAEKDAKKTEKDAKKAEKKAKKDAAEKPDAARK